MSSPPLLVAMAVALGLVAASWAMVVRLPEPDDAAEVGKPHYRSLSRWWWLLSAAAAVGLVWFSHGERFGWAWLVWASVGAVLATVDLLTTYLPLRLHWAMTGLLALALVPGPLASDDRISTMISAGLGSLAAGVLFWLVWRFSRSFGFGDVRLAFALGALTGAHGAQFWWTALLAGTMLGAIVGLLVVLVRKYRPHPMGSAFPYGPALWAGPWLALLLS